MELDAVAGAHTGAPAEVLWSAATAREIVADITRDIELGRMGRAAGLDLIHRVRARAAPDPIGSSPGRKAGGGSHGPVRADGAGSIPR